MREAEKMLQPLIQNLLKQDDYALWDLLECLLEREDKDIISILKDQHPESSGFGALVLLLKKTG